MPKVVGHVSVEMMDDGTTAINRENVPYLQLFGVAAVLHEMARQDQAMDVLQQAQRDPRKGIIVPRVSPS